MRSDLYLFVDLVPLTNCFDPGNAGVADSIWVVGGGRPGMEFDGMQLRDAPFENGRNERKWFGIPPRLASLRLADTTPRQIGIAPGVSARAMAAAQTWCSREKASPCCKLKANRG